MYLNSLMSLRTFLSIVILACFVLNTIPNQAFYNEEIVTNDSVILDNKRETSISRSEGYDLGIDSIEFYAGSDYWIGACSSECSVVEAMVQNEIAVKVTNYGTESVNDIVVNLKIKTTLEGLVQYDNTFFTDAFPASHPMHLSDPLQTGDSVVFTFNKTNDYLNLLYQDENPNYAKSVIFLVSGLSYIQAEILGEDDDNIDNDRLREDLEVAKWIENGEAPWDEVGPSITFGDTDDNGANSLDYINMHRATEFDHDADGCGWDRECTEEEGTDNIPAALSGNSAIATFNSEGWYKEEAVPSDCDWNTFGDSNCPKFTSEPYQDDYFVSPPFDLSGMRELSIGFAYRGNLENGDVVNLQGSRDQGASWENLWNATSEYTSMDWVALELDKEDIEELADFYGSDDTDRIYFRFQAFSDGDDTTECNDSPCSIFFIDNIVLRGGENVTRDVAVWDITVDSEFNVKDSGGNSLWREINATVINAGESSWYELPVRFSVTNLQGEDLSEDLDETIPIIQYLAGEESYGDINSDNAQQELFVVFEASEANAYYLTVELLVPQGKDFFPWNNSKTIEFRIFDTFFRDTVDDPDDRSSYQYTRVEREGNSQNSWQERSIGGDAYSGQYVWQYAKEENYNKDNPTTAAGGDDSLITQDEYDRDGSGSQYWQDVNVDLRAAYKPILIFAIKWDLAAGDKLEIRAATDFDSTQKITSGTWIVLKTYEGNCGCAWSSSDADQWIFEELDLSAFEGYQTWIEFRVVTTTGGGKGVMIDDIAVIGNEYRNNVMIESVDFGTGYVESDSDLSVTIKSLGLESQEGLYVYAQIFDEDGNKVWPTTSDTISFEIPSGLDKDETFTVDPSTAGNDWTFGSSLEEGEYYIRVEVWRDDEFQIPDEAPHNNVWIEYFDRIDEVVSETITVNYVVLVDTPPHPEWEWNYSYQIEVNDLHMDVDYTAVILIKRVDDDEWGGLDWWWNDIEGDGDQYNFTFSLQQGCYYVDASLYDRHDLNADEENAVVLAFDHLDFTVGNTDCGNRPYLNAFPTGSGGDIEDYEMRNASVGGANITVEATELIEGNSYRIDWHIFTPLVWYGEVWEMAADAQNVAEGNWSFDAPPTSVEYFIEPEVFDDLGSGCYMFVGRLAEWHDDSEYMLIEAEDWPFTLDLSFDECGDSEDCPFLDGADSPCEASQCIDHESEACDDYVANYCDNHDDPECENDEFPVITVLGDNVLTLTQTSDINYIDAGASCFDVQDGYINNTIEVHGAVVNSNNVGSYTIFYDCTDSDGNHATTQSRTIIVQADDTDDNTNITQEEIEPDSVPSLSLLPIVMLLVFVSILRRRNN